MCYHYCNFCEAREKISCIFYGYGDSGSCENLNCKHGSLKSCLKQCWHCGEFIDPKKSFFDNTACLKCIESPSISKEALLNPQKEFVGDPPSKLKYFNLYFEFKTLSNDEFKKMDEFIISTVTSWGIKITRQNIIDSYMVYNVLCSQYRADDILKLKYSKTK